MLFYGVLDPGTESVVEFFATREEAEVFIAEVRADEPELARELRVERVELDGRLAQDASEN